MQPIKTNRIFQAWFGANALYWTLGWVPQGDMFSAWISGALIFFAGSLWAATASETWEVMRKGEVGRGEVGIIGLNGVAFGLMYNGIFGVVWYAAGKPPEWVGPISSYGRAVAGISTFLLLLAPDTIKDHLPKPRWWIVVSGFVFATTLAYLLGFWSGDMSGPGI